MIILVDPVFNPNFAGQISSATKLGPGITIAKFLGAYGDRTPFDFVGDEETRLSTARQLYLQAEMMRVIQGNIELFNDIRLIVSEGIYRAGPTETLSGDCEKKNKGQLIYSQVINQDGNIDIETTFEIAEYWKDYTTYEKLILDYDTYNPDGSLTAQIGVEMPVVGETFDANFSKKVETVYNNVLQSAKELVEIKEK